MKTLTKQNTITKWLGAGALSLGLLAGSLGLGVHPTAADFEIAPVADMTVTIDESTAIAGVGETVTYTFRVRNRGYAGTANVELTANILGRSRFQNGSVDQPGTNRFQNGCVVAVASTRLICTGGFFAAGDEATVTVQATAASEPETIRIEASVSGGTATTELPNGNFDTEETPVIVRMDLRVTDIDGPTAVGDNIEDVYVIRVRNDGGSLAQGVRLRIRAEQLPYNFTTVEVPDAGSNFSCVLDRVAAAATPEVECTGGKLSAGEEARIRVGVRTENVVGTGSGTFRARIDPDNALIESVENNNMRTLSVSYNGGPN